MRVLAFVYSFPPFQGGSGMGMYDLLKRLVQQGYDIDVVTFNHGLVGGKATTIEVLDGMRVYRLSRWQVAHIYPIPKPTLHNWRLLRSAVDREHDLVYTRTRFFFTTLMGLLVSYAKGLPMMHTEPGSTRVHHDRWWVSVIALIWDWTVGRLVARRARCIGVCLASTEYIRSLGAKNTRTIYNGVDRDIFKPASTPRPDQRQDKKLKVLYVGRLMWTKGADILSDIADRLDGEVDVLVAGSGHYPVSPKIRQLGHLEQARLANVMRESDMLVLPSRMEGLSRAIQEAMSVGLPVIASDVGGNRELVWQDRTGLLVKLDTDEFVTAISKLQDRRVRLGMSQKALEASRRFDWGRTVSEYKEIMEGLVCNQKRSQS